MRFLTLGDLKLALDDLFLKRNGIFSQSKICQVYAPLFASRREQLGLLPGSTIVGVPLTEELSEKDKIHDDSINTMLSMLEATLKSPRASESLKKSARHLLDTLHLTASDTVQTYPQEAINAKNRTATIEALKGELQKFTLPEGGTLYDIAQDYLAAARDLDALLSERAKLESMSDTDRREVPQLRVQIIAEINRCRAALSDELKVGSELPTNLDAQIFGYFDELHQQRAQTHQLLQESKQKQDSENRAKAAQAAKEFALRAQLEAERKREEAEEAERIANEAKENQ